ncbi:hypothetical protein BCAH1134_C0522 (plasmid) [Bacillus cereus AH1134]|nr:hypothetical protein BCAH1134_C0522 [Bacillus cereus AH1134]
MVKRACCYIFRSTRSYIYLNPISISYSILLTNKYFLYSVIMPEVY